MQRTCRNRCYIHYVFTDIDDDDDLLSPDVVPLWVNLAWHPLPTQPIQVVHLHDFDIKVKSVYQRLKTCHVLGTGLGHT